MTPRARLAALALALLAGGCGRTDVETVLPWCQYRRVTGPGGSGMWAGGSHTEVRVRRWWGWSTVFDGDAAPGLPIVVNPETVLVLRSGAGWILRADGAPPRLACGDEDAVAEVPPSRGFVDCIEHRGGPARGVATDLRVRRLEPGGRLVAQQDFTTGVQGRVFLTPTVQFYDDEGTPYLVSFRDPWTGGTASPEQLEAIACELIPVGAPPTQALAAPPGHHVTDCSDAAYWGRLLGRGLTPPAGRS